MLLLAVCGGCARDQRDGDAAPREVLAFENRVNPGDLSGFNLLFITIDTVRRDHLGCYGMADARTPVMDRLANRGVLFDHAVATQPSTLPSHCTMMTGLDVPTHGVRTNGKFVLRPEVVTLAETLKDRGYATAAFTATYVLDARFGLSQGFDTYHDEVRPPGWRPGQPITPKNADVITDLSVSWLTNHLENPSNGPIFMWVHYFDAHLPYEPPQRFARLFPDSPYDGEIAFIDSEMKRLLDLFDRRGLTEKTLIVLASDHGEGLGEHGEKDHSRLIYDTTIRIPLIISCPPFFDAPLRVSEVTVATMDIMPTVLSLLGIDAKSNMDGINLVTTPVSTDRAVYLETLAPLLYHNWAPLHGLRRIDAKYIDAPRPEYYRLIDDPGELNNVLRRDPDAASELAMQLEEVMARHAGSEHAAKSGNMDEATARRLASLGYVTTGAPDDAETSVRPDPKDMVPIFEWLRRDPTPTLHRRAREIVIQTGLSEYLYRRGLILAETAHDKMPDKPAFLTTVGLAQYRMNWFAQAILTLTEAQQLHAAAGTAPHVLNEAVLIMALHRHGRVNDALRRWRELRGSAVGRNADAIRVVKEAAALLGSH